MIVKKDDKTVKHFFFRFRLFILFFFSLAAICAARLADRDLEANNL